jgi:hypothetical protein
MTEKYSFKGWSLKEWARHNKESLKALLLFLFGFNYFVGFSWEMWGLGLLAIFGKMAVDSFEYWLKS